MAGEVRGGRARPAPPVKVTKYKPPAAALQFIGIVSGSASLTHLELNATSLASVTFTQTIFDTTTRADSARILLTNSTGNTGIQRGAVIRAKAVTKLSGTEGYLNDKHVDYESISKNGERKFELGNDFVVTITQVNQLADYNWKMNKQKRHMYTLSLVGFQSYFEPGEWYTLVIGSAGTEENIASTAMCYSVRCSVQAGGIGYTSVSFLEMYENWKFDSNETARSIASGQFNRFPGQQAIYVASSTDLGVADYYCDGTADDVEGNAAIQAAFNAGGGDVVFKRGTYNLTTSLTLKTNVQIWGEGASTILNAPGDYSIVACVNIENARCSNIRLSRATSNTNAKQCFYGTDATGITLTECIIEAGSNDRPINVQNVDNFIAMNNTLTTITTSSTFIGIQEVNTRSITQTIENNIIENINANGECYGMHINDTATSSNISIQSNKVSNFNVTTTSFTLGIYLQGGKQVTITNNYITGLKNPVATSRVTGLYLGANALRTKVTNNYLFNNGADTLVGNTNGNQFVDLGTDTQEG